MFQYKTQSEATASRITTTPPPNSSIMLRPPEHQVAGHQASEGQLGPLVDGTGRFYKPLQSEGRGEGELAFYSSFYFNPRVPASIRPFFPAFHGTLLLPASDAPGLQHPHLVLEDLLAGLRFPSIIDFKIGARTWPPQAPDDYVQKCLKKDRQTTSIPLGFRISGLQVNDGGEIWRPDRTNVRQYTVRDVRRVLRYFVSTNSSSEAKPDSSLASSVYGGSGGVLAQLLELKAWFEDQTLFHFYSTSVLVAYEKDAMAKGECYGAVRVRLVDFAHVVEGNGVIDHNFLGGLCSLIKFISETLTDPSGDTEEEKTQASVDIAS